MKSEGDWPLKRRLNKLFCCRYGDMVIISERDLKFRRAIEEVVFLGRRTRCGRVYGKHPFERHQRRSDCGRNFSHLSANMLAAVF